MITVATFESRFTGDNSDLNRAIDQSNNKLGNMATGFNNKVQNIAAGMTRMGGAILTFAAPVVAGFGFAIVKAVEFEDAFAGVMKTVDASPEQFDELRQAISRMATDTENPLSALDDAHITLAKIMELGGQLGVPTDQLSNFTQIIGELTVASDMTAESAATMLARFANVSNLPLEDLDKFTNALVELGNSFPAQESDIMAFADRIGAISEQAGLADDQVLALSVTMASLNMKPEAGGTAVTQIFSSIIEAAGKGGTELQLFADTAGLSADQFARYWEAEPIEAFKQFLQGFDELSSGEQIALLDELGLGGHRVSDAMRRLSSNTDLLTDALNTSEDAWFNSTARFDEASEKANNAAGDMRRLKNQINDTAIKLGYDLLPAMQQFADDAGPVIEGAGEWAEKNPELAAGIFKVAIAAMLLGTALIVLGNLIGAGGTIVTGLAALTTGSASFSVLGLTIASTAIAPVALLAMGFLALHNNWGGVNDAAGEMIANFQQGDLIGGFEKLIETLLRFPYGIAIEIGDIVGIDVEGGLSAWPGIFDNVVSIIATLGEKAVEAIDGLLNLVGIDLDFSGWGGIFSPITDGIQGVINKATEAINNLTEMVGLGKVFGEGGVDYNINNGEPVITRDVTLPPALQPPEIDSNATGGILPANTPSWINERGAELIQLPTQSKIISHSQSRRMMANAGGLTNNGTINVYGVQNVPQLVDEIYRELRNRA